MRRNVLDTAKGSETPQSAAESMKILSEPYSRTISTIRSFLFNETLSVRVGDGSWNRILPGDTVNLDGTGSVFVADEVDGELERRCEGMDVHPAGILAGQGYDEGPEAWRTALERARVEPGTRSLRLGVPNLEATSGDDAVELRFALGRGAFATSVLREIAATAQAA